MSNSITKRVGSATICVVIGAGVALGGAQLYRSNKTPEPYSYSQQQLAKDEVNTITEDTIIKELKKVLTIEIAKAEVNTSVSIVDSWGSWSIFKNVKTVYFTGNGIYKLDFDKMDDSNIRVNNGDKTVIMYMPTPKMSVDLNQEEYQYTTDKGVLRFDEVELTPEQVFQIEQQAKNEMLKIMAKEDTMKTVKDEAANQLSSVVRKLVNEKYDIQIKWVE